MILFLSRAHQVQNLFLHITFLNHYICFALDSLASVPQSTMEGLVNMELHVSHSVLQSIHALLNHCWLLGGMPGNRECAPGCAKCLPRCWPSQHGLFFIFGLSSPLSVEESNFGFYWVKWSWQIHISMWIFARGQLLVSCPCVPFTSVATPTKVDHIDEALLSFCHRKEFVSRKSSIVIPHEGTDQFHRPCTLSLYWPPPWWLKRKATLNSSFDATMAKISLENLRDVKLSRLGLINNWGLPMTLPVVFKQISKSTTSFSTNSNARVLGCSPSSQEMVCYRMRTPKLPNQNTEEE